MDNKLFTIGLMIIIIVLSVMGIVLMVSFLINNAGSIGFVTAPFLALGFAYILYCVLAKMYNKYLKGK